MPVFGWNPDPPETCGNRLSLRASVGGGQISLTSVLKRGFVHVLLCLFALTGPSCLFRPRASLLCFAPMPKRSFKATRQIDARRVPKVGDGSLSVGCAATSRTYLCRALFICAARVRLQSASKHRICCQRADNTFFERVGHGDRTVFGRVGSVRGLSNSIGAISFVPNILRSRPGSTSRG